MSNATRSPSEIPKWTWIRKCSGSAVKTPDHETELEAQDRSQTRDPVQGRTQDETWRPCDELGEGSLRASVKKDREDPFVKRQVNQTDILPRGLAAAFRLRLGGLLSATYSAHTATSSESLMLGELKPKGPKGHTPRANMCVRHVAHTHTTTHVSGNGSCLSSKQRTFGWGCF